MAVGTVSGISPDDQWQLISTTTPSGTSFSLTGFTGYKHIWIVGVNVTKSGSDYPGMRPNNDSSAGYYSTATVSSGTATRFLLAGQTASAQAFSGKIYDVDKSIPHKVEWGYDSAAFTNPTDGYMNPVPITSVNIITNNGSVTYTGGTVYVYGIPA